MRCEAMVGVRAYSKPGRCLKTRNVKPVNVSEGLERVRVRLCAHHQKVVGARR